MRSIYIRVEDDSISDAQAIGYVKVVIQEGRISDNGNAYCYATKFHDNTVVCAQKVKTGDSFMVYRESTWR